MVIADISRRNSIVKGFTCIGGEYINSRKRTCSKSSPLEVSFFIFIYLVNLSSNFREGGNFIQDSSDELRRQIYILFSHLLHRPDSGLRKELCEGVHLELFERYDEFSHSPPIPDSWQPENIPELGEWQDIWAKEINFSRADVNFIESVYKPWTMDDSCQMPFADEKGFIMGDWAHHMLHLYEQLGFELPDSFSHCPDHLLLELEFMSLLVEEGDHQHQQQFLHQHLNWIDDLLVEAQEEELDKFYIDLIKWLLEFLRREREYLSSFTAAF